MQTTQAKARDSTTGGTIASARSGTGAAWQEDFSAALKVFEKAETLVPTNFQADGKTYTWALDTLHEAQTALAGATYQRGDTQAGAGILNGAPIAGTAPTRYD